MGREYTSNNQIENDTVSVIIPVYNVADYLRACVDSVMKQTYQNLEIWLVDDGSTDGSGELCDFLAEMDSRIRVVHQENGGLSDARNAAISRAIGAYITFLDSDDVLHPLAITCMVELMEQEKVSIVQAGTARCEQMPELPDLGKEASEKQESISGAEIMSGREFLLGNMWEDMACGKLYRRDIFSPEGSAMISYRKGIIHEDYALTYQLIYAAEKIAYLPMTLYFARVREGSITQLGFRKESLILVELTEERMLFYQQKGERELYDLAAKQYYGYLLDFAAQLKENNMLTEVRKNLLNKYRKNISIFLRLSCVSTAVKLRLAVCFLLPSAWRW